MFKQSSFSKTLLLTGLLVGVMSLVACGRKEATTSSSTKSTVTKTSSSSSSLSKNKASTSTEAADTENASSESDVTSAEEETPSLVITTTFDVQAIDAGDFGTLAGTWTNDIGQVVVIEGNKLIFIGNGEPDPNQYHLIESQALNETGRVGASVGFYNNGERQGGFHLSIVPAGVANVLGEVTDRDHLEMGHMPTPADSGEHFFRQ